MAVTGLNRRRGSRGHRVDVLDTLGRPMPAHDLAVWLRARAEPGSFALR